MYTAGVDSVSLVKPEYHRIHDSATYSADRLCSADLHPRNDTVSRSAAQSAS